MSRTRTGLALLSFLLAAPPAFSQPEGHCTTRPEPAATLLFPYFEVDNDDPAGKNTLMSIRNVSEEPTLAHVVVWSRCTAPVLDFTLYLEGRAVQSLDLRRLLAEGRVPVTGADIDESDFPSCTRPLSVPEIDNSVIRVILATLAGHNDTETCEVIDSPLPTKIVGFVTVDALNDCSDTIHTPLDEGYFEAGGTGLASNANVLSGDLMLLDGRETSAAVAIDAVAIVADSLRFSAGLAQSFYRGFSSDRLPLDTDYSARFLNGVGPGTTTELIVWLNPFVRGTGIYVGAGMSFYDEQGQTAGFAGQFDLLRTPLRVDVGEVMVRAPLELEPLGVKAGSVEVDALWDECPVCVPALFFPHQLWVAPVYTAAGGLSVGLRAVQRSPFCTSMKPITKP